MPCDILHYCAWSRKSCGGSVLFLHCCTYKCTISVLVWNGLVAYIWQSSQFRDIHKVDRYRRCCIVLLWSMQNCLVKFPTWGTSNVWCFKMGFSRILPWLQCNIVAKAAFTSLFLRRLLHNHGRSVGMLRHVLEKATDTVPHSEQALCPLGVVMWWVIKWL